MVLRKGVLALESGRVFEGQSFGADGERFGEIVFNTSITGYQEILTDPSYFGQIICMTTPHIGNYGVNTEDMESVRASASGFVVREESSVVSNWRASGSLSDCLKEYGIIGISGIDTRALTRHIREAGTMRAVISSDELNHKKLIQKARDSKSLSGRDLVKDVTCTEKYEFIGDQKAKNKFKIAVLDCGCKTNILRELRKRNCEVIVFPAFSTSKEILSCNPSGLLISNGPGDPSAVTYVIETARELIEHISNSNNKLPLFGICLGHQMLSLALGGKTYKLKFGHRGANHPVKDLITGKIEITSQNHGFCVKQESLSNKNIDITHKNLYDGTLEGICHRTLPIFSVQYHPEASPGPHESEYLFNRFLSLVEKNA